MTQLAPPFPGPSPPISTRQPILNSERAALRRYHKAQSAVGNPPSYKECMSWFAAEYGRRIAQSIISRSLSTKYEFLDVDDAAAPPNGARQRAKGVRSRHDVPLQNPLVSKHQPRIARQRKMDRRMADSTGREFVYPSPMAVYAGVDLSPLSDEKTADGKSFVNPLTGKLSEAYEAFVNPLDNGVRGGFDVHIYYYQANEAQSEFAFELWQRIRHEFPELRIYKFFDRPIGPHPVAMFEVNIFTPAQFGAFIPWLVINRGPLSALIHPNCVPVNGEKADPERDHTQRATWMGDRLPLDLTIFKNSRPTA